MKMKRLIYILFVLIVLAGCKRSFLDLSPVSNSNANNFFKTRADFELALNNAYATLYTVYNPQGVISYCGELLSDNTTLYTVAGSGGVNAIDKYNFRDYTIAATNQLVNQFWNESYTSLYNVNVVIDKIQPADLDDAWKTQVITEMRFLRALYYFGMVQVWGDLPLVTAPIPSSEAFVIGRTPQADV